MVKTCVLALTLWAGVAAAQEAPPGLLPPAQRVAVPSFDALTGPTPADSLAPGDLVGRVTVVNLWYEY